MEDKAQLAPAEAQEMTRVSAVILDKMYMEDKKRKLNFVVKNKIENVFAGLTDLQRFVKVVDPESEVSIYGGTPGQVGFTVQHFKKSIHVSGGGNGHSTHTHTTRFRGVTKIEEMTYPTYVKTSSVMEINGAVRNSSVTSTYIIDRGDGTVLVMMTADEKGGSFEDVMRQLLCVLPCCIVCWPCCRMFYDSQMDALGRKIIFEFKSYLSISSVETTSFYTAATPVATAVVVQPAPSPGGDIVQQLESLKKLHDQGVLTAEQYEAAKNKVVHG